MIAQWILEWQDRIEKHKQHCAKASVWSHVVGIPSVILPLLFSPSATALSSDGVQDGVKDAVVALGFVLCSCTSALNLLLRCEQRAEKHLTAARLYHALALEAGEVLAMEPHHRYCSQVVMRTLRVKFEAIQRDAPAV